MDKSINFLNYLLYTNGKLDNTIDILSNNKIINLIFYPTITYFLLVSILTPYKELRYILPICPLIIIITIYFSKMLLQKYINNKKIIIILGILFGIIMTTINLTENHLDFTYEKHNNIAQKIENLNSPILYVFNTTNNRFLDDIYLFTLVDNSYILNIDNCYEENLKEILGNTDISNGLVLIFNEGINEDNVKNMLNNIYNNSININYIQRMNACNIYYINKFNFT